jgi:hypothetical protein
LVEHDSREQHAQRLGHRLYHRHGESEPAEGRQQLLCLAGSWRSVARRGSGALPDLQFPQNGNFDSVDPKASPPWPLSWDQATIAGVATCVYQTSGGVYGTKKFVIHLPAGSTASDYATLTSVPFPYNPIRDVSLTFLHEESAGGDTVGYKLSLFA